MDIEELLKEGLPILLEQIEGENRYATPEEQHRNFQQRRKKQSRKFMKKNSI